MQRADGTMIGGKYRIRRLIGRGGASFVYLAEDVRLGSHWAVKEIFPEKMTDRESLSGVLSEARLLKHLNHPALPRIVNLIYGSDSIVIVMDYIEGRPLDRVLRSDGPPDAETAVNWTIQIAEILDYLHSQNPPVIYRDLKPANLIIGKDGRIRLIDFNAARRYRPDRTRDTEPLGTRGFAPPEQYGVAQTDARSDLYALGATILALGGGKSSPVLAAAAKRCMRRNPSERFQSASELLRFLRNPGKLLPAAEKKSPSAHLILLTLILSAVFLISGIFFRALSVFTTEASYRHALIEDETATPAEKLERLYGAIRSEPGEPEAYLALIGFYEQRRMIDEEQSRRLVSCLLENSAVLGIPDDKANKRAVGVKPCEIFCRAAMLEFFAYEGKENDAASESEQAAGGGTAPESLIVERALAADLLFSKLSGLSSEDREAEKYIRQAGFFHRFCTFLSDYSSNPAYLSDPRPSDLAELLSAAEGCTDTVRSGEAAMSQYASLVILSELVTVTEEYRDGILKTESGRKRMLALDDQILDYTGKIRPDSAENRELLETVRKAAADSRAEIQSGQRTGKD